jgi:hypothetical protein
MMEAKMKHLEFVQTAIGRMSTSSFLFKGWTITIATALSAFAATDRKRALFAIAVVTSFLFWGLDGYYLWLERRFIRLYEKVLATPEERIDFVMTPMKATIPWSWLRACFRPHLWAFYLTMMVIDTVGIFVVRSK